jgi:hypothetical protein
MTAYLPWQQLEGDQITEPYLLITPRRLWDIMGIFVLRTLVASRDRRRVTSPRSSS